MKRFLALLLVFVLLLGMAACGESTAGPEKEESNTTAFESASESDREPEPEATPEPTLPPSELAVGDVITLPFAEITIDSVGEKDEFKVTNRSGNASSSVSFGAKEGYTNLYVCGTVKEEGEKQFSSGSVAGYAVVNGNKASLSKASGSTRAAENTTIFFFSYELPREELGAVESCRLYFGFNDQFEKSSGDFEDCRYRYAVTVDPSAGSVTVVPASDTVTDVSLPSAPGESSFSLPTRADDLYALAREAEQNTRGYSTVSTKDVELEFPNPEDYLDEPIVTQIKFSKNGAIFIMPKPKTGNGNLGTMEAGTKVTLIAKYKNFYFFVADDGRMGWNGKDYFDI